MFGRRIRTRPLTADERHVASSVFGQASWLDDVRVTDIRGLRGRAFTIPGARQRIYCNMGTRFDATLAPSGAYPVPGQLLIHELAHAWQIHHARSSVGFLARGAWVQVRHEIGSRRRAGRGYNAYALPFTSGVDDGIADTGDWASRPDWESLTIEQQATVVDRWFARRGPNL